MIISRLNSIKKIFSPLRTLPVVLVDATANLEAALVLLLEQ